MPRVLLIGRHPELQQAMEASEALAGCEFLTAAGNVDAVRRVRGRGIDLVLTDPDTPVHEDLALVAELRESRPGIKAIVLAPTAAPAELIEALRSHVFACFTAPFSISEIAEMARRALDAEEWRDGIRLESGLPNWISLKMSCRAVTAERLIQFMSEYRRDLPEEKREDLLLAFREMLMNALEHGAGFDPEKVIDVTAIRTERTIVYHFRDPGPGFAEAGLDWSAVSNSASDPLGHVVRRRELGLRPGGFGILLARQIVDEMFYNERGNEVVLVKWLDPEVASEAPAPPA